MVKNVSPLQPMNSRAESARSWIWWLRLAVLAAALAWHSSAVCQDRAVDDAALRGNRAEISITVRDTRGQVIQAPATVKIYHSGMLTGQAVTSHGRVSFILSNLGDYTISVDASGYQPAQKDVFMPVAVQAEEDINLRSDSSTEESLLVRNEPLLAPKARDALDKGLKALKDNNLDKAEKHLDEAMKLAPGHPDVLYARGVVYLKQGDWAKAQALLEKATQLDPKHAPALSALGMTFVNAGKFEQAIPPLQRAVALEPSRWETHLALAKAYYHQQQYEEALKESQEGLTESHGPSIELELLLAQSLTAVGRYEEAAQTLRDFLKNHPDCPRANTARRWLARLADNGKIRQP